MSQVWRRFLTADRDNGDLWKQICLNSGPSDIPCLTDSADYRRLAMGLRLRDSKEPPAPQEQSYAPTTRPENYFAVVDVYKRHEQDNGKRRKEIIASLVCPVSGAGFEKNRGDETLEPIALQGVNPYSANMKDSEDVRSWRQEFSSNNNSWSSTPVSYAARVASKESRAFSLHRVDVALFRRDNATSVCLLHGAPLENFHYDDEHVYADTEFGNLTLAGNDTGMIARGLIDEHSTFCMDCFTSFALVLPNSGSDKESQWLVNSHQAVKDGRVYEPTAKDLDALSKIRHFGFGLEYVEIRLWKDCEWDFDRLDDQNELVIVLEGLCWE